MTVLSGAAAIVVISTNVEKSLSAPGIHARHRQSIRLFRHRSAAMMIKQTSAPAQD
jgi:hypothetical protein